MVIVNPADLFISAVVIPKLPSPFLNLTTSAVDLPWFSSNTVTVVEPLVIFNGFRVSTLATAGSVLAGLAYYLAIKNAPDRMQMLKLLYEDELQRALQEDGSSSSTYISPKVYYPEA